MTSAERTISTAAMQYISRQPSTSPTAPLTTREARMPLSSPERMMPTLRALSAGREYWAAKGMKMWGMTEQSPVRKEKRWMVRMSRAAAMASSERTSTEKLTSTMRRRLTRSASGMMKKSPRA